MRTALVLVATLALPALGCELYIDIDDTDDTDDEANPGEPDPDPPSEARAFFNANVLPLLEQECGACHSDAGTFIGWMDPEFGPDGTVYTAVLTYPGLVAPDLAGDSRLITKGQHEGPAWTPEELNIIVTWMMLEGLL